METSLNIEPGSQFSFIVAPEKEGARLDVFVTEHFPHYSRSFFRTLIEHEQIRINDTLPKKCGVKLKLQDSIVITFPPKLEPKEYDNDALKNLGIEIIFQHEDFLVVYKPAGVLVHPPTEKSDTISLVDWLLGSFKDIKHVGYTNRPGIVHRLDKDTSGVLLVALNNHAHATISDMFRNRTMKKTYYAVVTGHPQEQGSIDFPIGRHPAMRRRMTHLSSGRSALTHFKVVEYFEHSSLVEVELITGRTHQIRVHFATLGHPLLGDTLYGTPSKQIKRQALHAKKISFEYHGATFSFEKELPKDLVNLIAYERKQI